MIACPYQDLFWYIYDAIHEKMYTEGNEKDDKLKEIKSVTRLWKENDRCKKVETVISRLRADKTFLTHGYLMEKLTVPEYELYHSHAMTVKHLTDCANVASLKLNFLIAPTQTR